MAARESIHPGTGDPRAECRRKPAGSRQGTPRQDQEAGSQPAGGASRTHEGAGERADQEGRKPGEDREPGGPQALRELAAARGEGRKAGAICGGTSLRPIAGGPGEGAQALETGTEGQTGPQAQAGGDRGPKACQRAASQRRRRGESRTPERGRPEGWPEGKAGDEGREPLVERRSRKAAGGLSGSEGRKPGAEAQPESEACGSGRKSELRARPKCQGKGGGRKAPAEGRESEPRRDGGRRIDGRREVAGSGLMGWRRRELETRSRQGRRRGASQAGGSAGGQEQAARDGCRSQGLAARPV